MTPENPHAETASLGEFHSLNAPRDRAGMARMRRIAISNEHWSVLSAPFMARLVGPNRLPLVLAAITVLLRGQPRPLEPDLHDVPGSAVPTPGEIGNTSSRERVRTVTT